MQTYQVEVMMTISVTADTEEQARLAAKELMDVTMPLGAIEWEVGEAELDPEQRA